MPRPDSTPLRLLRTYRLVALPWLVHWLAFGSLLWGSNYFRGGTITLPEAITFSLPGSLLWFLATPFVIALARRVPLERRNFTRGICTLIGAGALLHVGFAIVEYTFFRAHVGGRWPVRRAAFLADWSVTDLIRFGVVVLGTKAYDGYRTTRLARRRARLLRAELAEAELELLHLRLQPHFLFNALHAITELVHLDPARADRALVALGDLLRRGLATSGRPVVPLSEELEALEAYLDLERIRFDHALDVRVDVEPSALPLGVPNFALQPVVENAIHHGLRGRDGGTIEVRARVRDGRLEIAVHDDGAGLPAGPRLAGRGLANVRDRLARLYGEAAGLELLPGERGGAVARLWLPGRAVGAAPTAGPAGEREAGAESRPAWAT